MGRTGGDELEDNLLLEPEVGDADVCLERPSQSKKRKKQDLCAAEKDSRPVRAKAKASRKVNAGPEEEQPGQLDVARSQKKAKKRRSEAPSNTSRWDSSSLHGASPAHVASYFNETYFQEKRFAQVQRAEKEIPKEKFLDLCKSPHTTEGLGDHLKSLYPQWQSKFKTSPRDTKGRPVVLLVCSSAIRAVEIFKALRDFNALGRIGKLFAKHFKVSEQIEFLTSTPIRLAIGTPNRLAKLIDEGALSLRDTETLLIDCARDKKQMTVFEINDLRRDLFELIDMHALPCIQKGKCKVGLY